MTEPDESSVTHLLQRWSDGESEVLEELMALVYDELECLAKRQLFKERHDHTPETKALVHEAYLKLVDQTRVKWSSRAHFYAVAAQIMRRILVDHARRHKLRKHGGGGRKVPFDEAFRVAGEVPTDLLALDDALKALAETDPEKSRLVEMRFFGGLVFRRRRRRRFVFGALGWGWRWGFGSATPGLRLGEEACFLYFFASLGHDHPPFRRSRGKDSAVPNAPRRFSISTAPAGRQRFNMTDRQEYSLTGRKRTGSRAV